MAPVASTRPGTSCFLLLVLLLHSILLCLLSLPATADGEQVMLDSETLQVGQSLYNEERNYRLKMEGDCNLALYDGSQLIWQSGTGGRGTDCRTEFQRIGNSYRKELVIVRARAPNQIIWRQPNWLERTQYVLVLQPDRNVVIYSNATWATNTGLPGAKHVTGDQVLMAGDKLEAGRYLIDAPLNYKFVMQEDCNLVLHDGVIASWETGTAGRGTRCHASLTDDGDLVIYDGETGKQVWTSYKRPLGQYYALVLQPDRDVVVYTDPVWHTGTSNNERAAKISSGDEKDGGGLGAGRKTMINMVTNKAA